MQEFGLNPLLGMYFIGTQSEHLKMRAGRRGKSGLNRRVWVGLDFLCRSLSGSSLFSFSLQADLRDFLLIGISGDEKEQKIRSNQ